MARKWRLFLHRFQSFLIEQKIALTLLALSRVGSNRTWRKFINYLVLCALFVSSSLFPVFAQAPSTITEQKAFSPPGLNSLVRQKGISNVIAQLQEAARQFHSIGDKLNWSVTLINLSLAYQQAGQWQDAEQAIQDSLKILQPISDNSTRNLYAQALLVQGQLLLTTGKPEQALKAWQDAEAQSTESTGKIRSKVYQSRALQELGLYRESLKVLKTLLYPVPLLQGQSDSLKASAFRSLGITLRVIGDLEELDQDLLSLLENTSQQSSEESTNEQNSKDWQQSLTQSQLRQSSRLLEQSLKLFRELKLYQDEAESLLSLGNTMQTAYYRAKEGYNRSDNQFNSLDVQIYFLEKAIESYGKAATLVSPTFITSIKARLNLFSLLIDFKQRLPEIEKKIEDETRDPEVTQNLLQQFNAQLGKLPELETQIYQLPDSRSVAYVWLNLAQSLSKLEKIEKPENLPSLQQILEESVQQADILANTLQDLRVKAYSQGNLAKIYMKKDLYHAQLLTEKALKLAEEIQAPEIVYEWQWQLGRILAERGKTNQDQKKLQQAIVVYEEAVKTINLLHQEYLSGLNNRDVSFSFRDNVELVYQELIELYLPSPLSFPKEAEKNSIVADDGSSFLFNSNSLNSVINTFENLQVLELENFLRCSLQSSLSTTINQTTDEEDSQVAVLYPILLPDRLEILLKLPQKPLIRRTTLTSRTEVEATISKLNEAIIAGNLKDPAPDPKEFSQSSEHLYNLLFRQKSQESTIEQELQKSKSKVKTLVFVLGSGSSAVRNFPIAALHDGTSYLIQKDYGLTLNPVPRLLKDSLFQKKNLKVLAAGVFEPNSDPNLKEDYSSRKNPYGEPLPGVKRQLEQIEKILKTGIKVLRNQAFTADSLKAAINSERFEVVHLATHGSFSSNFDDSFVLGYKQRINLNQLSQLIQSRAENRPEPIELLVLNACQTAFGDTREGLGIAGVALRSGARRTIASIFDADDESAALLMIAFYENLLRGETVSQALRLAQLNLLQSDQYSKPYQWATFVLVGNWR